MNIFNPYQPKLFVIKNSLTKEVKVFKTRAEFIEFLKKEVILNEEEMVIFEKDVNKKMKEHLLYKYLPKWYQIDNI